MSARVLLFMTLILKRISIMLTSFAHRIYPPHCKALLRSMDVAP
ncbi:hypothetical protein RABR111495_20735 [Rahnella bruchi]